MGHAVDDLSFISCLFGLAVYSFIYLFVDLHSVGCVIHLFIHLIIFFLSFALVFGTNLFKVKFSSIYFFLSKTIDNFNGLGENWC